jgi:hypothetical protein
MLVEPLEDQMQRTTWHLPSHSTRLNVDGGTILFFDNYSHKGTKSF